MSDFACSSSRSRFTIEDLKRISTNNGTAQRQESFPGPHYRIRDLKHQVTFSVYPQKGIWSRFPNLVFFALENPCGGARNQNLLKGHLISKRVYRFWAKPVQNLSPLSHYKVLDGQRFRITQILPSQTCCLRLDSSNVATHFIDLVTNC